MQTRTVMMIWSAWKSSI